MRPSGLKARVRPRSRNGATQCRARRSFNCEQLFSRPKSAILLGRLDARINPYLYKSTI